LRVSAILVRVLKKKSPEVKETAKDILAKAAGAMKALAGDAGRLCAQLAEKSVPIASRILRSMSAKTPGKDQGKPRGVAPGKKSAQKDPAPTAARAAPERRQIIFFGLCSLLVVSIVIAAIIIALNPRQPSPAAANIPPGGIPPEELFIPDEPDFIPDFLLDREPRHFWSVDDIRPFWRSPGNPAIWQDMIHSAVDELMESVP